MTVVSTQINDGIARVTVANPPVNALSQAVRAGLLDAIETLDADDSVRAVVLICDGRTFIAGADITEFDKPGLEPTLVNLVNRLERATKPWVAAIHGTALGGGLEVALSCHYRIANNKAKFGFPEVHLGLMPGAGGTVRLPRVIDIRQALSMVTSGKPIDATMAQQWGLINSMVDAADSLADAACAFANEIANSPCPLPTSDRPVIEDEKVENWDDLIEPIRKKARGQIAPVQAAEAIRDAAQKTAADALEAERVTFDVLKKSEQSKAMRYLFFAERQVSKPAILDGIKPSPIDHVGVIGGGTMGAGIGTALLLSNHRVTLIERDDTSLTKGIATVKSYLEGSLKRGLIDDDKHAAILANLDGSIQYESLADVDLVIEAVFEDMGVKIDVFSQLDRVVKPTAILATNTSYLDINQIAAAVSNPLRVVGLHFFSPAHIMKLLEIVKTDSVADDVLATSFALAKKLRKIPVLAGVCDGFIGNRIMSAYRRECEYMLEDGALPQDIDSAMVKFGFPMGIFAMQDLAGLDIAWAMRQRQVATRDPNQRYVAIGDRLCELGRFGRKTGSGWYTYSEVGKSDQPDEIVIDIILSESARQWITRRTFSAAEITDKILQAMRNEGSKILEEGVALNADAIDVVMVNGYGFPRWRGGPMFCPSAD